MGHGDQLLICDANFPSHAQRAKFVIHAESCNATELTKAVLYLLPLDSFVKYQAMVMKQVDHDEDAPIVAEFQSILNHAYQNVDQSIYPINIERVERFEFYSRAKKVFAIFVTGETRLYGNLILTKGVIDAQGNTVVSKL